MASVVRSNLRRALGHPLVQMLGLAAAVLTTYYHAFYGVARADQLIYLYRTAELTGFWSLTFGAYALNRTHSIGDFVLFRPALYFVLGIERWLWGYNFTLWQATSIAAHVAVVLCLYRYFAWWLSRNEASRAASEVPLTLALFFGLNYAGTEMVAWHHVVGYLVFCILLVQSARAYQKFLLHGGLRRGLLLVAITAAATLTYELGNLLALCLAAALLIAFIVGRDSPQLNLPGRSRRSLEVVVVTGGLAGIPVAYASWSVFDYVRRFGGFGWPYPLDTRRFLESCLLAAGYWFLAAIVPAALDLHVGGRVEGTLAFSRLHSWPFMVCLIATVAIGSCLWLAASGGGRRRRSHDTVAAVLFALLGMLYAAMIAAGRGL